MVKTKMTNSYFCSVTNKVTMLLAVIFFSVLISCKKNEIPLKGTDLIILMDESGSFKFISASQKNGFSRYVTEFLSNYGKFGKDIRVGIIRFGADVVISQPLVPTLETASQYGFVRNPQETNFTAALDSVYSEFERKKSFNGARNSHILLLTDGRLMDSTGDKGAKLGTRQIRDSLITEIRQKFNKLSERGCIVNTIIIGGDAADNMLWKELTFATEGLYYALPKGGSENRQQLENIQNKVLSKILGLYQISLISPESKQSEFKPIVIAAHLFRDTLLVREADIALKAEIVSHSTKKQIVDLQLDAQGSYFATFLDKPQTGTYTIRLEATDEENTLAHIEQGFSVGEQDYPKTLFWRVVTWTPLLGIGVLGVVVVFVVFKIASQWLQSKKTSSGKSETQKINEYVEKVKKLIKDGKLDVGVEAYAQTVEKFADFADRKQSETIALIVPHYEEMWYCVYEDIKRRFDVDLSEKFNKKKEIFEKLYHAAFDKKKNSAHQIAFAKKITYALDKDNFKDLFEDIHVILSSLDKNREDCAEIFTYIIDSLKDHNPNAQENEQARRVMQTYLDLINIDENNVETALENSVEVFKEARQYFKEAEQIYRYYDNILRFFKPALSTARPQQLFLTVVRDFIKNNENNWEQSKP